MMLSKREIVLLIIMMVVVSGAVYFMLFFMPTFSRINELELQIPVVQQEIADTEMRALLYAGAYARLEELQENWQNRYRETLPPYFDDVDILRRIQRIFYPHTTEMSISFERDTPMGAEIFNTSVNLNFTTQLPQLVRILAILRAEGIDNRVVNYSLGFPEVTAILTAGETTETFVVPTYVVDVTMQLEFLTLAREPEEEPDEYEPLEPEESEETSEETPEPSPVAVRFSAAPQGRIYASYDYGMLETHSSVPQSSLVVFTVAANPGYVVSDWTITGGTFIEETSPGTTWDMRTVQAESDFSVHVTFEARAWAVTLPGVGQPAIPLPQIPWVEPPPDFFMPPGISPPDFLPTPAATTSPIPPETTPEPYEPPLPPEPKLATFVQPNNGQLAAAVDGVPVLSGQRLAHGSEIIFTAAPAENFRILHWRINGEIIASTAANFAISLQEPLLVEVVMESALPMPLLSDLHVAGFAIDPMFRDRDFDYTVLVNSNTFFVRVEYDNHNPGTEVTVRVSDGSPFANVVHTHGGSIRVGGLRPGTPPTVVEITVSNGEHEAVYTLSIFRPLRNTR